MHVKYVSTDMMNGWNEWDTARILGLIALLSSRSDIKSIK